MSSEAILVHPDRGPSTVQLTLNGVHIHYAFGRAGQPHRVRTETLADAETAKQQFETRIFRLVSKGYRLGHHHSNLIEAIAKSPNDPEAYEVYADWLAARGDPRALLIEHTRTPRTASEIADLLDTNRWQFVRRDWANFGVVWWMGFVRSVRLRRYWMWWSPTHNAEPDGDTLIVRNPWARAFLLSIRRHPSGRFLRWVEEDRRVRRDEWTQHGFGVEFDFDVEPWIVRLVPRPVCDLNLNTATAIQLSMLPGVGSELAERIVNLRSALEGFDSLDQLRAVPGIGHATVVRLRDLIIV